MSNISTDCPCEVCTKDLELRSELREQARTDGPDPVSDELLYPYWQCEEAFMRSWPSVGKNIESSIMAAFGRADVPPKIAKQEAIAVLDDVKFNLSKLVRYYVMNYLRTLECARTNPLGTGG